MPVMSGAKLAQEMKFLVPDVPVILISGKSALPPNELAFVDAHFGFGTSLDDLLWTMRILSTPRVVAMEHHHHHHLMGQREQRETTRWADST
jgi:hypothetical protein